MAQSGHRDNYKDTSLSSQPTSREWHVGSEWRFTTFADFGKKKVLTFRVTDQRAKSCNDGDWRRLILLQGEIGRDSEPAYLLEGRRLWVSINANICDDDDDIRGVLSGATFEGDRALGGLFAHTKLVGHVKAQVVPP
jgi:hypothetical protein